MERHKNKLPQSNYTDIYGGSYLLLWHALLEVCVT